MRDPKLGYHWIWLYPILFIWFNFQKIKLILRNKNKAKKLSNIIDSDKDLRDLLIRSGIYKGNKK